MVDRALIVIADIGGYTKFLKVHRINLAHAQDVVARLLESVIDGAKQLKVSKLEGDAVLFFCWEKDRPKLADELKSIRNAFEKKKQQMIIERLCSCEGCTQVSDLTLKFVAHAGEVAAQKVKRFTEIAGFDVIVVHRLLKNHVPLREYVLGTDAVRPFLDETLPLVASSEDLESVGVTPTFYLPLDALGPVDLTAATSSGPQRVFAWAGMTWRALPYMTGMKKACDGFKELAEAPTTNSASKDPTS